MPLGGEFADRDLGRVRVRATACAIRSGPSSAFLRSRARMYCSWRLTSARCSWATSSRCTSTALVSRAWLASRAASRVVCAVTSFCSTATCIVAEAFSREIALQVVDALDQVGEPVRLQDDRGDVRRRRLIRGDDLGDEHLAVARELDLQRAQSRVRAALSCERRLDSTPRSTLEARFQRAQAASAGRRCCPETPRSGACRRRLPSAARLPAPAMRRSGFPGRPTSSRSRPVTAASGDGGGEDGAREGAGAGGVGAGA